MFEVTRHGQPLLSAELGGGGSPEMSHSRHLLPRSFPAVLLPGPPFLGPRGTEQLVDARSPPSSCGEAWDMGLGVALGDNPGAGREAGRLPGAGEGGARPS